jgi:lysylphosphatidylglycerol synthetase-like protein (DUF2156 family)
MSIQPKTPFGPWTAAWCGLAVLATLNGLSRGLYAPRMQDDRAHQVSTATLIAALVPYVRAVDRRWPIPTTGGAAVIGVTWTAMTVAFEFGFGHYVAKQSWQSLLADYDLPRGRLWPLVLVAIAAAPPAAREVRRRRLHA